MVSGMVASRGARRYGRMLRRGSGPPLIAARSVTDPDGSHCPGRVTARGGRPDGLRRAVTGDVHDFSGTRAGPPNRPGCTGGQPAPENVLGSVSSVERGVEAEDASVG